MLTKNVLTYVNQFDDEHNSETNTHGHPTNPQTLRTPSVTPQEPVVPNRGRTHQRATARYRVNSTSRGSRSHSHESFNHSHGSRSHSRGTHGSRSHSRGSRSRSSLHEHQHAHSPSSAPEDDTTSTPTSGKKRPREADEPNLAEALVFVKVAKTSGGKPRPKASDYDVVAQEVLNLANAYYRCLISTRNAFPEPAMELEFTKEAWKFAHGKVNLPLRRLDADLGKVVCQLLPSFLSLLTHFRFVLVALNFAVNLKRRLSNWLTPFMALRAGIQIR